jgi:hypothetical protein
LLTHRPRLLPRGDAVDVVRGTPSGGGVLRLDGDGGGGAIVRGLEDGYLGEQPALLLQQMLDVGNGVPNYGRLVHLRTPKKSINYQAVSMRP